MSNWEEKIEKDIEKFNRDKIKRRIIMGTIFCLLFIFTFAFVIFYLSVFQFPIFYTILDTLDKKFFLAN